VTLGIENVPLIVLLLPLKVWTPVPALNVPELEILPGNVSAAFAAVLFQIPPPFTVTSPLKALAPVAEDMVRVPVTLVVPLTVSANPAAVKVVPVPTLRPPPIVRPTTVVVLAVPLIVKFPLIAVVVADRVLMPLPLSVRW